MSQGTEPSDGVSGRYHQTLGEVERGAWTHYQGVSTAHGGHQPSGGRATQEDTRVTAEEEEGRAREA